MLSMIRAWLRSLIGWDDVAILADNSSILIDALRRELDTQEAEIQALKHMRTQRETRAQATQITDWERIQAEYAANPENFKEN